MKKERNGAKRSLENQASTMTKRTRSQLKPVSIDQNVLVPVPSVDKGRLDFPNIRGIVMSVDEEKDLFEIGTKHGVLNQKYARNQFMTTTVHPLLRSDIPTDKTISFREVARKESNGSGQGFIRCNCLKNCTGNRCKCLKYDLKCTSKCHSSGPCKNE